METPSPYKALHMMIPLSKEAPLIGNVALCKQIAKVYYLSKGLAVQLDIHGEKKGRSSFPHAHLLAWDLSSICGAPSSSSSEQERSHYL
jgi:hypothetical protein